MANIPKRRQRYDDGGVADDTAATGASNAAQAPPRPTSPYQTDEASQPQSLNPQRAQQLGLWLKAGLDQGHASFLASNPELIDQPALARQAAADSTQQGYQPGTAQYFEAIKTNFWNRYYSAGRALHPEMKSHGGPAKSRLDKHARGGPNMPLVPKGPMSPPKTLLGENDVVPSVPLHPGGGHSGPLTGGIHMQRGGKIKVYMSGKKIKG